MSLHENVRTAFALVNKLTQKLADSHAERDTLKEDLASHKRLCTKYRAENKRLQEEVAQLSHWQDIYSEQFKENP